MGIFNFFGTSGTSITTNISSNTYAHGYLANTTGNFTTTYGQTFDFSDLRAKTIFSKYYPVFSDFSKREPTTIEVNDVYFKIINDSKEFESLSYEKQLERNQAILI